MFLARILSYAKLIIFFRMDVNVCSIAAASTYACANANANAIVYEHI